MAFKGRNTAGSTPTPDDDDFPEETDTDNPTTESGSVDDWLESEDTTTSADEEAYQQLNPPAGDWIKKDRFEVKVILMDGDSLPGDRNPQGRTVIQITGKPEVRVVDGATYQPFLMARFSPDRRDWEKDDGTVEMDSAYKLWLEATNNLFLSIYGRKFKKPSEVVKMLELDEYVLNTYRGNNGPTVSHVKPMRKQCK